MVIENITRHCDDTYECEASNGVPPSVSHQIKVTVECTFILVPILRNRNRHCFSHYYSYVQGAWKQLTNSRRCCQLAIVAVYSLVCVA